MYYLLIEDLGMLEEYTSKSKALKEYGKNAKKYRCILTYDKNGESILLKDNKKEV